MAKALNHCVVWAGVLGLLMEHPVSAAPPPPNEMCPVMPTEKASPEFTGEFGGRTVRLCCRNCVAKFRAKPHEYTLIAYPPPPNPRPSEWWDSGVVGLAAAFDGDAVSRRMIYGLGALLVLGGGFLARRRQARGRNLGRLDNGFLWATRPTILALGLLGAACVELWFRNVEASAAVDRANTKAAQATEAGQRAKANAPLLSWCWPQGLHELPKGVSGTYYRGNDERSELLSNGGKYRTVTFHLGLERPDGAAFQVGDNLGPGGVYLRFRFVRAAGTADHFFRDEEMAKSCLIPTAGDQPKPIPLVAVRPGWEWSAALPLGSPVVQNDYGVLRGVCLVTKSQDAASAHYYLQYVLHFQKGVLQPESRVWMMPVVLSGILNGPKSDEEWFSDRPIPEIIGENTKDPRLLGIENPDGVK